MIYTPIHMAEKCLWGVTAVHCYSDKSQQKYFKCCEIDSVQKSHSAPGHTALPPPTGFPSPSLTPYCSRLAEALHLSRTPPPERIEKEEEKKKERQIQIKMIGQRELKTRGS